MPIHLLSRRFLFSPLLLRSLALNTGTPQFTAHSCLATTRLVDIYYDTTCGSLASQEISLRTRNGIWQLKQRLPFTSPTPIVDHLQEAPSSHLSTYLWKEFTGRTEIMPFLEQVLGKTAMLQTNEDGRQDPIPGATLTFNFAMKVVAELEMTRISYILGDTWKVDLDHVNGSGYQVGKVEIELAPPSGEGDGAVREKMEEIEEMMERYKWFFRSVPDPEGGVKGKMCAWFQKPGMVGTGGEGSG